MDHDARDERADRVQRREQIRQQNRIAEAEQLLDEGPLGVDIPLRVEEVVDNVQIGDGPVADNPVADQPELHQPNYPEPLVRLVSPDPLQQFMKQILEHQTQMEAMHRSLHNTISGVHDDLSHKISTSSQQIMSALGPRIAKLEEETEEQQRKVNVNFQQVASRFQRVEQEVEKVKESLEQREQPSMSLVRSTDTNRKVPEEMKFCGRGDKPILFLKELKMSLGNSIHRWQEARELIKLYLIGPAREWYMLVMEELDGYSAFESQFRQQYWSLTIQYNLRHSLENGRYNPKGALSPAEYLISRRLLATQLNCFEDEAQFVFMISRHYDEVIQNAQINGGITTIQRLGDVLEAYSAKQAYKAREWPQWNKVSQPPFINNYPQANVRYTNSQNNCNNSPRFQQNYNSASRYTPNNANTFQQNNPNNPPRFQSNYQNPSNKNNPPNDGNRKPNYVPKN